MLTNQQFIDLSNKLKIQRFIKDIPEDERDARIFGKFKALAGLVLKEFNHSVHKVEPFRVPTDWPVVGMVDLHLNIPQAIGFYAVDPQQRSFVIDEIWKNLSPEEIAEEIIRRKLANYWRLNRVFIDPLAKGDSHFMKNRANVEDSYTIIKRKLAQRGILLDVGSKDKDSGVRNIKNMLVGVNKMPSLFLFDICERHLYEMQRWVYDDDGKPAKCMTGDTLIDTPNGQHRIKDLVGKDLWVYSYDLSENRFRVNRASNIRKTGEKKEVWKLTMDRGVIFATPDHPILLRNGTWKSLKDLKPYDSLMALYRTLTVDGYGVINPDGRSRSRVSEHRYIYSLNNSINDGYEVHHIDGNYLNHNPENLQCVSSVEHQTIHILNCQEKVCKNCGELFIAKKTYSKFCKPVCGQIFHERRRGIVKRVFCRHCLTELHNTPRQGRREYCNATCKGKYYREMRGTLNHKVISIGFYGYEDVYNMEVGQDHNFVANGVVVHNCNDHFMENLYRFTLTGTKHTPMTDQNVPAYEPVSEATGW